MLTKIRANVRNTAITFAERDHEVGSFEAEQVAAHLMRAEIELRYAAADLTVHGALADYPEIEVALAAVVSAITKLEQAAPAETRQDRPKTN